MFLRTGYNHTKHAGYKGAGSALPSTQKGRRGPLNVFCTMQRAQDDDMNDPPLLDDFKILKRRLFQWQGEQQTSKVNRHEAQGCHSASELPDHTLSTP